MEGKPLNVFIVRKEPKTHGTEQWIEGPLKPGARVVVVDDVVTTGASTIKAVEKAVAAGFKVVKALVLLDGKKAEGKTWKNTAPLNRFSREKTCLSFTPRNYREMKPFERIVFPLDLPTEKEALEFVKNLSGLVGVFKVGLELSWRPALCHRKNQKNLARDKDIPRP